MRRELPALLVASAATLGSLYFSVIVGYAPCNLCWWQRIFMFPLPVILGVSLARRDGSGILTARILAALGAAVAAYHVYLENGGAALGTCAAGTVSCAQKFVVALGFVTIPMLSLAAFLAILILLLIRFRHDQTA